MQGTNNLRDWKSSPDSIYLNKKVESGSMILFTKIKTQNQMSFLYLLKQKRRIKANNSIYQNKNIESTKSSLFTKIKK